MLTLFSELFGLSRFFDVPSGCCSFNQKYYFDSGTKIIEFRDVDDLDKVVLAHSVAPHQPKRLFATAPATLLFEDVSSKPRTIYKLDCSVIPSKISNATQSSFLVYRYRSRWVLRPLNDNVTRSLQLM